MGSRILYHNLKSQMDKTAAMMEEGELVTLARLNDVPEAKLNAQLVHVKKGQRVNMFKVGDKSKKVAKSYDRLLFFRDLESGQPFVVVSESKKDSIALFYKGAKIGDYVRLHMPDKTNHTVAEVPVVQYCDVLMPLREFPNDLMVDEVEVGPKLAVFAVELDPAAVNFYAVGVEEICGGTLCDGTMPPPCPCLAGTGVEKFALAFKLKVPVKGLEDTFSRIRSLKFSKKFFGPSVLVCRHGLNPRKLNLYQNQQLKEVVMRAMPNVERLILAGWIGYSMEAEDDLGTAAKTHLSSLEVIVREDEDGNSLVQPLEDLPLPALR